MKRLQLIFVFMVSSIALLVPSGGRADEIITYDFTGTLANAGTVTGTFVFDVSPVASTGFPDFSTDFHFTTPLGAVNSDGTTCCNQLIQYFEPGNFVGVEFFNPSATGSPTPKGRLFIMRLSGVPEPILFLVKQ